MNITPTSEQMLIHDRIRQDRDHSGIDWTKLIKYESYALGNSRVTLTNKQMVILAGLYNSEFCDNVCGQVIGEAVGRIALLKWICEKDQSVDDLLNTLFVTLKIEDIQNDLHYNAFRDGNTVLAINWDEGRERGKVYIERWWNGSFGIYINYDDNNEAEYAVKEWTPDIHNTLLVRRLIWFNDRMERWVSHDGGFSWVPYLLSTDYYTVNGEEVAIWPIPWLKTSGDPLGIPYVHFINSNKKFNSNLGLSELSGGVLGFQDQINDLQWSISAASRLTAYQQYYATGVTARKRRDGTDDVIPLVVEPGAFHMTENKDAKYGTLPAGDLSQLISAHKFKLTRVAQMTATPLHSITGGDWPSGEALIRAEMPSINKARKQIGGFKTSWTFVAHKLIEITNRFSSPEEGNDRYEESINEALVESLFDDPERRDAVSRSIVVHNITDHISDAEALRIMGYSEERVTNVVKEIQADNKNKAKLNVNTSKTTKQSTGGNNNINKSAQ